MVDIYFSVEEKVSGSLVRVWMTTALECDLAHPHVFYTTVIKVQINFLVRLFQSSDTFVVEMRKTQPQVTLVLKRWSQKSQHV